MEGEDAINASESFAAEAANVAIAAFNEGFILGRRYAEKLYDGKLNQEVGDGEL